MAQLFHGGKRGGDVNVLGVGRDFVGIHVLEQEGLRVGFVGQAARELEGRMQVIVDQAGVTTVSVPSTTVPACQSRSRSALLPIAAKAPFLIAIAASRITRRPPSTEISQSICALGGLLVAVCSSRGAWLGCNDFPISAYAVHSFASDLGT